jgi:hypothetical protein
LAATARLPATWLSTATWTATSGLAAARLAAARTTGTAWSSWPLATRSSATPALAARSRLVAALAWCALTAA